MTIHNILTELANEPSSNNKIEILKSYKDNELFKSVVLKALSPLSKFNIKKIPEYSNNNATLTLEEALPLLEDLETRKVTGTAGINHLTNILESLSAEDASIIEKIIQKDLRCGVSVGLMNKAIKNFIPEYPYMRCSKPSEVKLDTFPWERGVFSELKADGLYNSINYYSDGTIELLTRQGNEFPTEHFADIVSAIRVKLMTGTQTHGEILVKRDGVILSREEGNGILNSVQKGGTFGEGERPVLVVWDQIPLEHAVPNGSYNVPYSARYEILSKQVSTGDDHLEMIDTRIVYNKADAIAHYLEMLELGFEGVVIKHPDGIWRDATSRHQVKFKLEVVVDLEIVGFTPGKGKNKDLFGSIIAQSSDGLVAVKVSGIKDKLRKEISDNRESYMHTIMAVKSNSLTNAVGSSTRSLFLPRFVEFRLDKITADDLPQIQQQFEDAMKCLG